MGILSAAGLVACGGAPGEESASSADDIVKCASGPTVAGVDVSKYQGAVDWSAVAASGHVFAFMRVSDGTNTDAYFDSNWADSKAAGVYRGAYQFFRPNEDAIAQADLLLAHIADFGDGDIPPVIDVEVTGGVSASHIRAGVNAWSAHVKQATGRAPIVYTSPGFWSSTGGAESDGLWVANWGVSCPKIPASWNNWKFWQHSDHGSVPGISGTVDVDRFNGSLSDLVAYVGSPPSPVDAGPAPDAGVDSGGGGSPPGPSCASDGDCNPGSNGSGQICVQGTCVAGCNANWQCPGNTTCVSGQCQ